MSAKTERNPNVIARYVGGIHCRTQAAVRRDGAVHVRYQRNTPYGYAWGAWHLVDRIDPDALPETYQHGGNALRKPDHYTDFNCRLPRGD